MVIQWLLIVLFFVVTVIILSAQSSLYLRLFIAVPIIFKHTAGLSCRHRRITNQIIKFLGVILIRVLLTSVAFKVYVTHIRIKT